MAKKRQSSDWLTAFAILALGLALWREIKRRAGNNPSEPGSKYQKHGWALVTGASSGMGSEFARQLAARGYNLVLVARREARLQSMVEEINRDWGTATEVISADLSNEADITRIEKVIADLPDLEILVNNAGFGVVAPFAESNLDDQLRMIDVHVLATITLTRAALPGMLERHCGAIINVSSLTAFVPVPKDVTYGSTKAYLNSFTEALYLENKGKGVKFQALCPGLTATEFHDTLPDFNPSRVPSFVWMSAVEVVRQSLDALDGGPVIFVPGWFNRMVVFAAQSPILSPFTRLGSAMVKQ